MAGFEVDDMFELPSPPLFAALSRLQVLFRLAGFRVHKAHANEATLRAYVGKFAADDACYRYAYPENAGEFGDEIAFVVPAEISLLGKFTPESESTVVASLRRIFAHLAPSGAP